jgi:truncated hemoglobin YjbI
MQEQRERWLQLCEQAATEQDPEKLMALIAQINRLLEAKERRLRHNPPAPKPAD